MRVSLRAAVFAALAGSFLTGSAIADEITLRNESGEPVALDTEALRGCVVLFDQTGAPFEICRMEAINIAPEDTARRRPGATEPTASTEIVYRRVDE